MKESLFVITLALASFATTLHSEELEINEVSVNTLFSTYATNKPIREAADIIFTDNDTPLKEVEELHFEIFSCVANKAVNSDNQYFELPDSDKIEFVNCVVTSLYNRNDIQH